MLSKELCEDKGRTADGQGELHKAQRELPPRPCMGRGNACLPHGPSSANQSCRSSKRSSCLPSAQQVLGGQPDNQRAGRREDGQGYSRKSGGCASVPLTARGQERGWQKNPTNPTQLHVTQRNSTQLNVTQRNSTQRWAHASFWASTRKADGAGVRGHTHVFISRLDAPGSKTGLGFVFFNGTQPLRRQVTTQGK